MKEGSRFVDLDSPNTSMLHTPTKRKATDPNTSLIRKNSLIQESINKINKQQTCRQNESMGYGPLTQRLIAALIEQNLMVTYDNDLTDYLEKIGPTSTTTQAAQTSAYMSPKTMAKGFHFNTNQSQNIERKLKKTLIEQGILELDENDKLESHDENSCQSNLGGASESSNYVLMNVSSQDSKEDDELALEIYNLQNELKLVTKHCKQTIEGLLDTAKRDMQKQEIKKKLHTVDKEVNRISVYFLSSLNSF
jgi:hypothetical protein